MDPNDRYYRDSGAVPFGGSLMTTIVGLVVGVALGALYGFVSYYNVYIILQIFAVMVVGGAVGGAVNVTMMFGKVRNQPFSVVVAIVCGCAAVYAEWVVFFYMHLERWIVDPVPLYRMVHVAGIGVGMDVFGNADWGAYVFLGLWGVEALVIIGMVYVLGSARDLPFCEECGEWAEEFTDCAYFPLVEDEDKLRLDLEFERYEVLDAISGPVDPSHCLRATVYQCPCEGEENYLTIKRVQVTIDGDGDEQEDETDIVKRIWIPDDVVERLLNQTLPEDGFDPAAIDDGATADADDVFEDD